MKNCLLVFVLFVIPVICFAAEPAKPRIAISGQITVDAEGKQTSSVAVLSMAEMLRQEGAEPVIIDYAKEIGENVGAYDGLVLMGNSYDIDPSRYGAAPDPRTKNEALQYDRSETDYRLGLEREKYEYAALAKAFELNLPVLGICGGLQRINVVLGGTLKQHVDGQRQGDAPFIPVDNVIFEPGSDLAKVAGDKRNIYTPIRGLQDYPDTGINSLHHQAVDKLGKGLRIAGRSEEFGTVEAVESDMPDKFILGTQWHPELMPQNPISRKIVARFVEAVRAREGVE